MAGAFNANNMVGVVIPYWVLHSLICTRLNMIFISTVVNFFDKEKYRHMSVSSFERQREMLWYTQLLCMGGYMANCA